MAKVKLCRSLGRTDADRFGVDHQKATEGSIVECDDKNSEALIARRLAESVPSAPSQKTGKSE